MFRSQGITVDHTFGLGGDGLFQEAGYTQLSRGRLSNNLYVAAPENPRWESVIMPTTPPSGTPSNL